MQKEFSISNGKAMINFTAKFCKTTDEVLNSDGFNRVLSSYIETISEKQNNIYKYISEAIGTEDNKTICTSLTNLFKLLIIMQKEEIIKYDSAYSNILCDLNNFKHLIEGLYSFWRRLERYTIIINNKIRDGLENVSFIDANSEFSRLILNIYRKIEAHASGFKPNVYRQLPAGGNVGIITNQVKWNIPEGYEKLKNILFINSIVVDPPFIIYPKRNTRDGKFSEVYSNPLKDATLNKDHWFCYPAKVGELLAYLYFHRDFMAHGVTLCNLFEMAREEEYKDKKPDIVYVFGARDGGQDNTVFYEDKKNNIMLGYVSYSDKIDYFGYMKKMTLTLHNLIMINRGFLPIHGAMVNIKLYNGKEANVVIMGDSGAGKSECLEAFRLLSEEYISDMTVIFDDMGTVKIEDGQVIGYGTEIGAFVRLDDLDPGYAFREMDRSVFMNPDKTNARLVMPVATYKDITDGYNIDMFLYANNYEDGLELEPFNNAEDALEVFKSGARMAKGTTTEEGLVKTYFANPFGPDQRQEKTDILLEKYFNMFFENKILVGQLRTRLGIKGMEKNGPIKAAEHLLDIIKKL
ncbi:MAG: phosphoenolpyruvate carboxykinase [Clostridiaceae bacterium]